VDLGHTPVQAVVGVFENVLHLSTTFRYRDEALLSLVHFGKVLSAVLVNSQL
jgi:hypothetical protein